MREMGIVVISNKEYEVVQSMHLAFCLLWIKKKMRGHVDFSYEWETYCSYSYQGLQPLNLKETVDVLNFTVIRTASLV